MSCDNPECEHAASREYNDGVGNSLELCDECYFEAVWPGVRSVISRSDQEEMPGLLGGMFE